MKHFMAFGSWCDSLQTWRKLTGRSKYNRALTDDDFTGLLGPNFEVEWLHWSPFRPAPLDIIICTLHSLHVEWSILSDFGDQFPPFFLQCHDFEQYGYGKPKETRPKIGLKWCASCAISRSKGFKSLRLLRDLKNALGSQVFVDIVNIVDICEAI